MSLCQDRRSGKYSKIERTKPRTVRRRQIRAMRMVMRPSRYSALDTRICAAIQPPIKPPRCAQLLTPLMRKPRTNSMMAHCHICRVMSDIICVFCLRPYTMMAAKSPKIAPEAPTVGAPNSRLERINPTAPATV